jgi:hypothetical protein
MPIHWIPCLSQCHLLQTRPMSTRSQLRHWRTIQFCVHSSRMVVFNSGVGADSMEQQSAIPSRNDFIQSFQVVENPAARLRFGHHDEQVNFATKCLSRAHHDVECWFRKPENQSFPGKQRSHTTRHLSGDETHCWVVFPILFPIRLRY